MRLGNFWDDDDHPLFILTLTKRDLLKIVRIGKKTFLPIDCFLVEVRVLRDTLDSELRSRQWNMMGGNQIGLSGPCGFVALCCIFTFCKLTDASGTCPDAFGRLINRTVLVKESSVRWSKIDSMRTTMQGSWSHCCSVASPSGPNYSLLINTIDNQVDTRKLVRKMRSFESGSVSSLSFVTNRFNGTFFNQAVGVAYEVPSKNIIASSPTDFASTPNIVDFYGRVGLHTPEALIEDSVVANSAWNEVFVFNHILIEGQSSIIRPSQIVLFEDRSGPKDVKFAHEIARRLSLPLTVISRSVER